MKIKNNLQNFLSDRKTIFIDDIRKPIKILLLSLTLLTVTGAFWSCKKNDTKKPVCKIIAAAIPSTGLVFNFLYNSDGKPARISAATAISSFEYPTANTVIITTITAGSFQSKKIINVNAAGLATNVRIKNNIAGTEFTNDAFEYNGTELAKQTSTSSFNPQPRVSTYTWFNGNMITVSSNGAITESRDYFTDKPLQAGDVFAFTQFTQGFEIIRTKNLTKSTSLGSGLSFTYEFRSDGNISSAKTSLTNGNSASQDYQYECK